MGKADDNTGNGWNDFWARMWNNTFAAGDYQSDAVNEQVAADDARKAIEDNNKKKIINEKQNAEAATSIVVANAENATKNAAYESARNVGAGKAGAQALSGLTEDSTASNAANINSVLRSGKVQSQNDYLTKMGYANGLDKQANNLESGAFLNALGAIFGGASSGASVGTSIGGSNN